MIYQPLLSSNLQSAYFKEKEIVFFSYIYILSGKQWYWFDYYREFDIKKQIRKLHIERGTSALWGKTFY